MSFKQFKHIYPTNYLVVDPVIQGNAFFAHSENVPLAMLVDEREHIRELGCRRILKARQIVPQKKTVRNFVPSMINFQVSDYNEIINWNSCVICPAALAEDTSEGDIKSLNSDIRCPSEKYKSLPVTPRLWKGASTL
ncbi:hypothetical protein AVEN_98785-1 [Araneus ventricosus]|uniref:Uncharacterized protein n=1 Tax=Araneus ventricosus TaxID=182803 RepID=A0A4Y2WS68_ARAVE|nr:hypothetical protein AVEN_98785-1 [Araneus ventricosus]